MILVEEETWEESNAEPVDQDFANCEGESPVSVFLVENAHGEVGYVGI